jgi:hypothetical protein
MLIAQDRPQIVASDAGSMTPAPPSASVPGDTISMTLAPPAAPVNATPAHVEIQGIGLHLDPVDGVTLGDLPTSPPVVFTPPASPVADPTGANPGAPPADPIGSSGSSTKMRTIAPGDRPNVNLIATNTHKGTADRSNEVPVSPTIAGYTSPKPLIALVILAAVALAWWLMKRGRFAL